MHNPSPTHSLVCAYLIVSPNNCMNIIKNVTGMACEEMQESHTHLESEVFIMELIDWWADTMI